MYRTHTNGQLRIADCGKNVTLCGWVQRVRNLGGMTFVDLRDRYGVTQLYFDQNKNAELAETARQLGREFVIQAEGEVVERSSKNMNIPTGEIEILVQKLSVLNKAELPPFMIEDETDGGEELRMKFRYLDLRRNPLRKNLELRHKIGSLTRNYLDSLNFIDVETPFLIKSTPEGARDFVVPSRMSPGEFYALPQSPQVYKQLLMVAGFDRYYQIVRCFRDEDLRADRQPEFTQIDCEMSFIEQEDILNTFEGLIKHLFKEAKNIDITEKFRRMPYAEAMEKYGSDKPDLRFGMEINDITEIVKGKNFPVFEEAEYIGAINATGCGNYTRKELDALTEWVKRPQIGMKGLIYAKVNDDGSCKSSVDKFYNADELKKWIEKTGAKPGDLILVLCGKKEKTLDALGTLRLEMGGRLGLRKAGEYCPLWVVDFPLFVWDEETKRYYSVHHPFTSPKPEDLAILESNPGEVRTNAYDLVINGVEIGGGSIRIHEEELQQKIFKILGFTHEQAQNQFGFMMNAFKYGAPPHGGIAFGFDRLASMFCGSDSIRDVIAFPKNNSGRDLMSESPSAISEEQLKELNIKLTC